MKNRTTIDIAPYLVEQLMPNRGVQLYQFCFLSPFFQYRFESVRLIQMIPGTSMKKKSYLMNEFTAQYVLNPKEEENDQYGYNTIINSSQYECFE